MTMNNQPTNGEEAYKYFRASMILKDSSVSAWCRENNNIHPSNLKSAFYGSWNGTEAKKLVNKACEDADLDYRVAA